MDDPILDADAPWADPAIRAAFEAALGRFILAHNEVDYRVARVIHEAVAAIKASSAIAAASDRFAARVDTLELLSYNAGCQELRQLGFDRLRELNRVRNVLAHGFFDQNPFDGDYQIITKKKVAEYPATRVIELSEELSEIAEVLRGIEFFFMLDELDPLE